MDETFAHVASAVLTTPPTTSAGAMALLKFAADDIEGECWNSDLIGTAIRNAVAVLERGNNESQPSTEWRGLPNARSAAASDDMLPAPMSKPLAKAIARHKRAFSKVLAACGNQDIPGHLTDNVSAFHELVKTSCANDAEFIQKIRYLLDYYLAKYPRPVMNKDGMETEGDEFVVALDVHFNPATYAI